MEHQANSIRFRVFFEGPTRIVRKASGCSNQRCFALGVNQSVTDEIYASCKDLTKGACKCETKPSHSLIGMAQVMVAQSNAI